MQDDLQQIAATLKRGDRLTTTLGREVTVGAVHFDEEHGGRWWIEPEGADEYHWWLPLVNVVTVNGVKLGSSGR